MFAEFDVKYNDFGIGKSMINVDHISYVHNPTNELTTRLLMSCGEWVTVMHNYKRTIEIIGGLK